MLFFFEFVVAFLVSLVILNRPWDKCGFQVVLSLSKQRISLLLPSCCGCILGLVCHGELQGLLCLRRPAGWKEKGTVVPCAKSDLECATTFRGVKRYAFCRVNVSEHG